jgi:hypothetical protein
MIMCSSQLDDNPLYHPVTPAPAGAPSTVMAIFFAAVSAYH